jgi:SSS family transporter
MVAGFILAYLLITFLIGWWASKRVHNSSDFIMAGKQLPLYMAASALFATWFGSESILGAPAQFMEHGILGIIEDPFGAALCLALSGLLIARPLYNRNLFTFSDFFKVRFNRATEMVSAVVMVPSYFSWISAQLMALGIMLHLLFGVEQNLGIGLSAAFVLAYTIIGGLWSVSVTDFVQTIVIILGLALIAASLLIELGSPSKLISEAPVGHFRFLPKTDYISIFQWIGAWITIGLGSIPQQDVFQRVMAAKDEKTSVRACYISAGMYLTVAFLPILICWTGVLLHPDIDAIEDKQMLLPVLVQTYMHPVFQILFFGALTSAILSTASGAMLAPATVIGENLIKQLAPNMSDKTLLLVLRCTLVMVAMITTWMAWKGEGIFEMVSLSSAFSLVSLFVPLIGGLYWSRATVVGAIASMLGGLAVWAWAEHLQTEIPSVIYGLAASTVFMVIGSCLENVLRAKPEGAVVN